MKRVSNQKGDRVPQAFMFRFTLSKTNIAHENGPFQKENSLPHPFSGAMLVSGKVSFCKIFLLAFVVQGW